MKSRRTGFVKYKIEREWLVFLDALKIIILLVVESKQIRV